MNDKQIKLTQATYAKGRTATIKFQQYTNSRPALTLVDETGPLMVASVNLPDIDIPAGMIAIKTWSENDRIQDDLIKNHIIAPDVEFTVKSGHVEVPIYTLLWHPDMPTIGQSIMIHPDGSYDLKEDIPEDEWEAKSAGDVLILPADTTEMQLSNRLMPMQLPADTYISIILELFPD